MLNKQTYSFKAKIWIYPGITSTWHFVNIPKEKSLKIKKSFGDTARGWGSLPVEVKIKKSIWKTSIFRDRRSDSYILPLKASIRKNENIYEGDIVSISIKII